MKNWVPLFQFPILGNTQKIGTEFIPLEFLGAYNPQKSYIVYSPLSQFECLIILLIMDYYIKFISIYKLQ
jgi:hypothetical protein